MFLHESSDIVQQTSSRQYTEAPHFWCQQGGKFSVQSYPLAATNQACCCTWPQVAPCRVTLGSWQPPAGSLYSWRGTSGPSWFLAAHPPGRSRQPTGRSALPSAAAGHIVEPLLQLRITLLGRGLGGREELKLRLPPSFHLNPFDGQGTIFFNLLIHFPEGRLYQQRVILKPQCWCSDVDSIVNIKY